MAAFVAMVADALQIPLQLPPLPEIIDVVAMVLASVAIGISHLCCCRRLRSSSFPGGHAADRMGCVLAVIALRRRERKVGDHPHNQLLRHQSFCLRHRFRRRQEIELASPIG